MATILVVEDVAETRKPLARLLELEGYEVITAADALEAAGAVHKSDPDIILLDVGIPPMDGLTFLMLLRQEAGNGEIPVILITGQSDEGTFTRGQQLGVKGHLVKGQFEADELLALVRQHIRQPDRART